MDPISANIENRLDYIAIKALSEGRVDVLRKVRVIETFVKLNPCLARMMLQNVERDLEIKIKKGEKENFVVIDDDKIMLQDKSSDPNVSFKYPAFVPEFSSFLFIAAHEREHVRDIIRKAVLEGKLAMVFVRYFISYDSKGRLYVSGGLTWGKIIDFFA